MANEAIFITKSGVAVPLGTEMFRASWDTYAGMAGANLKIGMLAGADLIVNAFEAFKYRLHVLTAVNLGADSAPASVVFNNNPTRVVQFIQGSGNNNQVSESSLQIATVPAQVEVAQTVFLQGSKFVVENDESNFALAMSVRNLEDDSHILLNLATGALSSAVNGTPGTPDTLLIANGEKIEVTIDDNSIDFANQAVPAENYSFPRTWTLARTSGTAILIGSTGTATGSARNFSQTDTIKAQAVTGASSMTVTSNFGSVTTYVVSVGEALSLSAGVTEPIPLSGKVGVPFEYDITEDYQGGIGTVTYSLPGKRGRDVGDSGGSGSFDKSGNPVGLPPGLSLSSDGVITGTPTIDITNMACDFTLTDQGGQTLVMHYSMTIDPIGQVLYSPPNVNAGAQYSYKSPTSGITSAAVVGGAIPSGLELNPVTAELHGVADVAGVYEYAVNIALVNGLSETIVVTMEVYAAPSASLLVNDLPPEPIDNEGLSKVNQTDNVTVLIEEGSGQFQYAISGQNVISSEGVVQLYDSGDAKVNVVDLVTGGVFNYTLQVAGQGSICGLAIEDAEADAVVQTPCVDVVTDCTTPVTVGFNALHILRGLETGDAPYRVYPNFGVTQSAQIQNNGKPFVMFRSTAADGWALSETIKDGHPFVVEFAVDASVINAIGDVAIGITKANTPPTIASLEYSMVISTAGAQRTVEIRKNNIYQTGSRYNIQEGRQIGFGVYLDRIVLYIDGVLQYTLTSNAFSCSEQNLVFFSTVADVILGGKAGNLIYSIATPGTPEQVGIIDAQTGLYSPSLGNLGLITISGKNNTTPEVQYFARVRVIRPASRTSLEKAMIEGVPVDMWVADVERGDDLPLRLGRDGAPDKNQIFGAYHLGTLVGSGKIENTLTRNDFRNDVGATSSSTTTDKAVVTGAFLAVRRFDIVKRLIPFMKETNTHGVRQLHQMSTGCHQKMRVLMIWQSPECDETPVFDAIEVPNGLSYTPFSLEVGKAVQSNIPITIEAFPDKQGVIFHYNQYDKHFHRIGED